MQRSRAVQRAETQQQPVLYEFAGFQPADSERESAVDSDFGEGYGL
jgi:hypothetical protein